jgi:hypothetical protein
MSKEAIKTESESNKSLEDFTWDSEEFFGITPEVDLNQKVIDEVNEDDDDTTKVVETKTTTEKPADEDDEEEDDLFSTEVKTETTVEDDDEPDEDVKFFTTLSKELAEKKIFQHVTLTDGEEITEEKFFELHEQEVDARFEEALQDFITELNDEDGGAFIKFKRAGGKTSDFFAFYSQMNDELDVDIEKEAGQDAVLRKWYKTVENLDEEDIEDKLDWLKEGGKKKKYAEKYLSKMDADKQAAKTQFLNDQLEAQTKRENDKKEFVTKLKTTLDTTEAVGDFVFNKPEKSGLLDYILKPAVKLKSNQYLTKFQSDLNEIVKNNPEKLLVLAKLLKTDFDTTDLVVKKQTEAVKKVKSTLATKGSQLSSANSSKKRSLSEFF